MVLIEVPDELASQYDELARSVGQERNALIREALIEHLEDIEDIAIAREPGKSREAPFARRGEEKS